MSGRHPHLALAGLLVPALGGGCTPRVVTRLPVTVGCAAQVQQLEALDRLSVATRSLQPGESTCFTLPLRKGEFIRAAIAIPPGDGFQYVRLQLFDPVQRTPLFVTWAWDGDGYSGRSPAAVSFEASASGTYLLEMSVPPVSWATQSRFSLQVDEWISPAVQGDRQRALRTEPRVRWLGENAVRLRTSDPGDNDVSDLEFLRDELTGVRVVLLGEGSPGHGGGSEQHTKTRLVRFLHRELGFDVLAFEGGMYGHSVAWRALQSGEDPRTAFLRGQYRNAALSSHVQPLLQYLGFAARTDRPLELVGFDSEFSGTAPRASFMADLRHILNELQIGSTLTDSASATSRVLSSVIDGTFARRRIELLRGSRQSQAPDSIRITAAQVEHAARGRSDALFWSQILRSAANRVDQVLGQIPAEWSRASARDRHMGENLVWLSKTYYADRKIIVWAHTDHLMRNPGNTAFGRRQGYSAGHALWEALGEESFVIGTTAFSGTIGCVTCTGGMYPFRQDIAPDQSSEPEFEELMNAAGFDLAWVNLRMARQKRTWLGGAFLGRPLHARSERVPWSDVLDALVFIRAQESTSRIETRR